MRDETTKDVRIVLEIKREAEPELVMAYLYKHTGLATNFNVNLTCLVPTENKEVGTPQRLNLKDGVSLIKNFADLAGQDIPSSITDNLPALQAFVLYGSTEGNTLSLKGFLQFK